ncbi:hypothetical protein AJ80_01703 [Polytolypa hystricis UAMH7299]|uniref:SHSP domain-containing protein n=1 Tax=Polytolypa hystricis (strain UAMH7299) TaxID=1447883 RepID=A0A2B7YRD4_POLH7|nr:hypothetical protein AJ80_01703 [Polytolypa hystricis UAMH7299]
MHALRRNNPTVLLANTAKQAFTKPARLATTTTPYLNHHHHHQPQNTQARTFHTTPIPKSTNNMSLFPRVPTSEFGSLFRLLEDYDQHREHRDSGQLANFAPKFDVREDKSAYILDGELPGIDQKDITIEFSDPHTLVIKGRSEREYTAGTPPKGLLGAGRTQGTIEGSRQPRVEEEEGEEGKQPSAAKGAGAGKRKEPAEEGSRYWVSERSVGEFQRSFNFPTRVNQDGVKANLKKGVLNIVVPKASAPSTKRITIEQA